MTNAVRLKRTTHKLTWSLLAVWLAWEGYLLVAGLWPFLGPQTDTFNGVVYHGRADRMETGLIATVSGFPSGLFIPALELILLQKSLV
ncbi:MAG: hypothetical protein ACREQR_12275 [Candidatus Binataceae bacterium]